MRTIIIDVEDCKYYLPYPEGPPYSHDGGDCDSTAETCQPNRNCPLNRYLNKSPHIIIEEYKPDYSKLEQRIEEVKKMANDDLYPNLLKIVRIKEIIDNE